MLSIQRDLANHLANLSEIDGYRFLLIIAKMNFLVIEAQLKWRGLFVRIEVVESCVSFWRWW